MRDFACVSVRGGGVKEKQRQRRERGVERERGVTERGERDREREKNGERETDRQTGAYRERDRLGRAREREVGERESMFHPCSSCVIKITMARRIINHPTCTFMRFCQRLAP